MPAKRCQRWTKPYDDVTPTLLTPCEPKPGPVMPSTGRNLAMAERAQEDASAARVRLPDHPFALSASLQTHLVAAILFTEPQRMSALNKAQLLVTQLEAFPEYPWIGEHRAQYYEMLGEATNADKALEQAAVGLKNNPAIFAHAINLWRRKKDAREVLNVLNQRKG